MPDLLWNHLVWTGYGWPQHGEEWTVEMAAFCGMTPEVWKASVVREFIVPHLRKDKSALEIGCGHGRWSTEIASRVNRFIGIDLNESCVEYCKNLLRENLANRFKNGVGVGEQRHGFSGFDGRYSSGFYVNGGSDLSCVGKDCFDFIFSFDTFVHIEELETRAYIKEFDRVLKRQTMSVIHHAGNPTPEQRARGCRSQVTAKMFSKILTENGLVVIRQTDTLVTMNNDCITVFVKP